MPRILLFLLPALAFAQQQSYIVELTEAPALEQFRGGTHRTAARGFAAAQSRVRMGQENAMRAVVSAGGRVAHRLDTVANALIVTVPDAKTAAKLVSLPGVKRIEPVVESKAVMDRVLDIQKIREVWNALPGGEDNAGAGIRVAIVDSGVDIRHPGLVDETLGTPDGFPKFNSLNEELDRTALSNFNNKKVIAMRSYENLVDDSIFTRGTARDSNGHGTGVAFAAVGKRIASPSGPISGVAPKAFLGVYRITTADGGSSNSAATFAALDDAVRDGMDVINLSFGFSTISDNFNESLVRRIHDAGVIFIAAAGNNGDGLQSTAWPGSSPWVLGVGASGNDRILTRSVITPATGQPVLGFNGNLTRSGARFSGPFLDSANIGTNNELGCDPFPSGSMDNAIVLILRGTCNFEVKLNNAARAGAVAVILYNPVQLGAGFTPGQGENQTPVTWVDNEAGLGLKRLIANNAGLTVDVRYFVPVSSDYLSDFSSRGPTTGRAFIKPDVVAVGESFVTASPTTCCANRQTAGPGFTATQGTSLSAPVVAGAAAILKQLRPGLRVQDYRSLLVNTATALPLADKGNRIAIPHEAGAGRLDLSRARQATVTAEPLSISFGGGGKTPPTDRRILRLTNLGPNEDSFAISVEPIGDSQAAELSTTSLALAANASGQVEITMPGSDLRAGHHHGILVVKGANSDVSIRVPYWYGVASPDPGSIAIIVDPPSSVLPGGSATVTFRVTDSSGQALDGLSPEIESLNVGGIVDRVDFDIRNGNGLYRGTVRVGRTNDTVYGFRIRAGAATQTFAIVATTAP
jgi:minor extracellular serine protease Vpr